MELIRLRDTLSRESLAAYRGCDFDCVSNALVPECPLANGHALGSP